MSASPRTKIPRPRTLAADATPAPRAEGGGPRNGSEHAVDLRGDGATCPTWGTA